MNCYPIYLNLKNRAVLLVGAGSVALQKIPALLDCQANLRVVAPEALPEIEALARKRQITWHPRSYESSDLEGVILAIAATDDKTLQERIATEARARQIWVNVADQTRLCDFIAPSLVSRGDLQIAISTGGAAPALSKFIRQKLEPLIGPEYGDFVRLVEQYRPEILKLPKPRRDSLWRSLVSQDFLDQIKAQGAERAEKHLKEWIYGNVAL